MDMDRGHQILYFMLRAVEIVPWKGNEKKKQKEKEMQEGREERRPLSSYLIGHLYIICNHTTESKSLLRR